MKDDGEYLSNLLLKSETVFSESSIYISILFFLSRI